MPFITRRAVTTCKCRYGHGCAIMYTDICRDVFLLDHEFEGHCHHGHGHSLFCSRHNAAVLKAPLINVLCGRV